MITEKTVQLALQKAAEAGISHIVVASNTGITASLLAGKFPNIVCVTHSYGYVKPGEIELSEDMRQELQSKGVRIVTAAHTLSGAERGISRKFGGTYPVEIMAHTLRMFCQGVKVCVEIAVMALDNGAIPYGEEIIAIGGTGRGADTAMIIKPSYSSTILDTHICEVLCKPR